MADTTQDTRAAQAGYKLGRLPPRRDYRTLKLSHYLTPELPLPPKSVDYGVGVPRWPMFANDRIGDCTCAAAAHKIQAWTQASRGDDVEISEQDVIEAYKAITGYDGSEATDNGAIELDVLRFWRSQGIGEHFIGAFASVNPRDALHVMQAIHLLGGIYIGVALPLTAQDQEVWTITDPSLAGPARPWSWGGHAVSVVGYDDRYVVCVTWGGLKRMTWDWFHAYCEEAWGLLSPDWIGKDSIAPTGFDLTKLRSDLEHLGDLPPQEPTITDQTRSFLERAIEAIAGWFRGLFAGGRS